MAIEKIEILGAVLELPAKQHCQFSPFGPIFEVNGLDWQCYLAGSSKTAPRILIFSIAMGAKPSFYLKSIAIWAPAIFLHNNSFIATYRDTVLSLKMGGGRRNALATIEWQLISLHAGHILHKS